MDFIDFEVKPITYKLNLTEEEQKKLRPFFKVRSGASSRITKTIEQPTQPNLEEKVQIKTKEKGTIHIELWDRNSSRPENLLGKGEIEYGSLKSHEGSNEEWIVLKNNNGQEVGKALVEVVCHAPDLNLSIEQDYRKSIDSFERSFKKALDKMDDLFEGFGRFALPSLYFPSLTSEIGKDMIEEEQPARRTKGIEVEKKKQPETVAVKEGDELSLRSRDLMAKTFSDMQNSFEKTIEDMHNRFETMTRDLFSEFDKFNETSSQQQGGQKSGMDVESRRKETPVKGNLDQAKA